jgi:hypothetical protein
MEQQARAMVARDAAVEKQSQAEADVARHLGTLGVMSGQRVSELVTTSDTAQAACVPTRQRSRPPLARPGPTVRGSPRPSCNCVSPASLLPSVGAPAR